MSEPTSRSTRAAIALALILIAAAALRLWAIGAGIPHTVGTDEPEILSRSLKMMRSGNLNPGFFDYGGFTLYLNMAVASARFLSGAMNGKWTSLDQVWEGDFYLWCRLVTAAFSVLTVYIVYRVGRRWSEAIAITAALVAAVHPNLVRESHYALTDTPLMFFAALTLLLTLVAGERGQLRWYFLAGAATGAAAATKYNGGMALLMPIAAALVAPTIPGRRWAALLSSAGGAAVAFLIAAPYSLLDLPHFLNAFGALASHFTRALAAGEGAGVYLKHMRIAYGAGTLAGHPTDLLGWPALLLIAVGIVALAREIAVAPGKRTAAITLLVFPIAYFWMITHQSLMFARYTLPMVPMVCLGLAAGIHAVSARAQTLPRLAHRNAAAWLTLLIVLPPAVQAIRWDLEQRKMKTEEQAARWIQDNLPKGKLIVIDEPRILLPPGFPVEHSTRLLYEPIESYRARGVAYIVSSSQQTDLYTKNPERFSGEVSGWNRIFAETEVVKVFQDTPEHPGSRITILKLRN